MPQIEEDKLTERFNPGLFNCLLLGEVLESKDDLKGCEEETSDVVDTYFEPLLGEEGVERRYENEYYAENAVPICWISK